MKITFVAVCLHLVTTDLNTGTTIRPRPTSPVSTTGVVKVKTTSHISSIQSAMHDTTSIRTSQDTTKPQAYAYNTRTTSAEAQGVGTPAHNASPSTHGASAHVTTTQRPSTARAGGTTANDEATRMSTFTHNAGNKTGMDIYK